MRHVQCFFHDYSKLWIIQYDDSKSKAQFHNQTKDTVKMIIAWRGRDWRLLSFFILLPCLGLFNGLLCVFIGISVWSLPSRSPQTGMLHQEGETSERKAAPPHYHRHEEIIK